MYEAQLEYVETVDHITAETLRNGGGTFDTFGAPNTANGRNSWVVAVPSDHNTSVKLSTDTETRTAEVFSTVATYMRDSYGTFGTWIDTETDTLYVDSVVLTTRATAELVAKENGEIAIFDLESGTEYRIS